MTYDQLSSIPFPRLSNHVVVEARPKLLE